MIIPTGTSSEFKNGDKIVLIENIVEEYAIFCIGHEFEYVTKDNYGHTIKDGDIILTGVNQHRFTHKISLEQAKSEVKDRKDKHYLSIFLKDNCPNKTTGYSDREFYDACKIKQKDRKTYDDTCCPDFECVQYVKLDKKCSKYLRKKKLEKIDRCK